MSRFINTSRCRWQSNKAKQQKFPSNKPGVAGTFFFVFVFVIVYVNDNADDRASCLVPRRFRRVASADVQVPSQVDAALPRGPTFIRGFFFTLAGTYQCRIL
jgi:hypothetical protein